MWPTEAEYIQLFRSPRFEENLAPELRKGQVERRRGAVFYQRGSFGVVFRLVHPELGTVACKAFYRQPHEVVEQAEMIERYRLISELIRHHEERLTILIKVRLIECGLYLGQRWVPVVVSTWVQGQTIDEYIEDCFAKAIEVDHVALAEQFAEGIMAMEELGIAHGDLCPANLMVISTPSARLKLIDYDNMYVPELLGRRRLSAGSIGYLAIGRYRDEEFGPENDRNAAAVLFAHLFLLTRERWHLYRGKRPWLLNLDDPNLAVDIQECAEAWRAILNLYSVATHAIRAGGESAPKLGDFFSEHPSVRTAIRRAKKHSDEAPSISSRRQGTTTPRSSLRRISRSELGRPLRPVMGTNAGVSLTAIPRTSEGAVVGVRGDQVEVKVPPATPPTVTPSVEVAQIEPRVERTLTTVTGEASTTAGSEADPIALNKPQTNQDRNSVSVPVTEGRFPPAPSTPTTDASLNVVLLGVTIGIVLAVVVYLGWSAFLR